MFSVRCTQKLLSRASAKPPVAVAQPTTVLGDWYANVVFTRPEQLVVCISERTLLPVIVTAKDVNNLPVRVAAAVRSILREIGVSEQDIENEMAEMQTGQLAPTKDRRVLGSLNDFVFHFEHGTGSHPEMSLLERTLRLARMPCGPLEYAYPSEAALAAFAASNALKAAKNAA